ncbi:hypothetical protein TI04_04315 [Achromatium sp. WMS2]|nr:hypothetical protein TI04_04315 [Achromatium sp. WMS2]
MSDIYNKHYSDDGFWQTIKRFAKKAGASVLRIAFQLYYLARSPATPLWVKTVAFGALGYFILPIDVIPDVLPGVGFTDDVSVMTTALLTVGQYVTDEIKSIANTKVYEWTGM